MESRRVPMKLDRKIVEKNRRNQMKALYSKLNSLIPNQSSKEVRSLPDQLDEARDYIKKLQENLENMREKKNQLVRRGMSEVKHECNLISPKLEIHYKGSAVELVLATGLISCGYSMFHEIIRILHEERVEVLNANFAVIDNLIVHTIHSEIGETIAFASEMPSMAARLNKLVHDFNN